MKVTLVAYTPNPDEVCDMAAHTCVCKNIPQNVSEDFKSLRRALESGHESVAEHATFTFMIEGISRACSHQLVRHRMASYSQQSQRYVRIGCSSRDPFDTVIPESIRTNRQVMDLYDQLIRNISEVYGEMVDCFNIPPEDARYILPNACTTTITVTMNGRELRHFINLRTCNRAQWEIRELATSMMQLAKKVAPILMEDVGPNCMQKCGCQELKPCGEPVPFGAHTVKKNRFEDEWPEHDNSLELDILRYCIFKDVNRNES